MGASELCTFSNSVRGARREQMWEKRRLRHTDWDGVVLHRASHLVRDVLCTSFNTGMGLADAARDASSSSRP